MKKTIFLPVLFSILLIFQGSALAMMALPTQTLAPQVVDDPTDPGNNKVLQFQVADSWGDRSWADLSFSAPANIAVHDTITVQFDIYRTNDGWLENLRWAWISDGIKPGWGAQWDHWGPPNEPWTYPFGWSDNYEHTPTLTNGWTTIVMTWDFLNNQVYSQYGWQGSALLPYVDMGQPLPSAGSQLFGWQLALVHDAATGTGDDFVYIDNLCIYGSDIYDSMGFEDFNLGGINGTDDGQGAWAAGAAAQPVPIPSSLFLLASSLIGLAGFKRRM